MIGILSDSHDNIPMIKQAVRFFNNMNCCLVIHAGDFVAPFAAKELHGLSCRVKAVFGNCDGEKHGLKKAIDPIGEIHESPLRFQYDGLRFLVTHLNSYVDRYLAEGNADVCIFGHTHKPEIKIKGKILIINPGESGGWVSGKGTVALFDTQRRHAEIYTL